MSIVCSPDVTFTKMTSADCHEYYGSFGTIERAEDICSPGIGRRRRLTFSENWKRRRRRRTASKQAIHMSSFLGQTLYIFEFFLIFFQSQFLDHKRLIIPNKYHTKNSSELVKICDFSWEKSRIFDFSKKICKISYLGPERQWNRDMCTGFWRS